MLTHTDVDLALLQIEGRSHKWKRPSCRNGCEKVWGHGYVPRYIEGYGRLWLKRYRCPHCRIVTTMFPSGLLPFYQSTTSAIYQTLKHRLTAARWPAEVPRQRARHWLRKFMTRLAMDFPRQRPVVVLDHLYAANMSFLL